MPVIHEKQDPKERREERIEGVVALVIVLVIAFAFYGFLNGWFTRAPAATEQLFAVSTGSSPHIGNESAKVRLIEFSDYRCPSCQAFQRDVYSQLKAEYIDTGKLLFVYRDFPLEEVHPDSIKLAAAVRCADEQGGFWEFHDAVYAQQPLDEAALNKTAAGAGLNLSALYDCRRSGESVQLVMGDENDGVNEGAVSATPTFFINGHKIVGTRAYEEFKKAIDAELAKQ